MNSIDFHCHSTASDGVLRPADLVRRAAERQVRALALTDHDDIAGLAEARAAALEWGIEFVNGVEISVSWRGQTVHIVGLGIDPEDEALRQGLESVRNGRQRRARRMADALDKAGIPGSLEGAYGHAGNPHLIGRTHFARFLVEQGHCKDMKSVFKRYLTFGKPGYVVHEWAQLADAVSWIGGSGGLAVVAHPGRYKISGDAMNDLLSEFKDVGGAAVEVVTGSHAPDQYQRFAHAARHFGLLASAGSDFHAPGESYLDLGRLPPLPQGCEPVWTRLGFSV